jgi:hypothetical protein
MKWLIKPRFAFLDIIGIAIITQFNLGFLANVCVMFIWLFVCGIIIHNFFHEPLPRS